MSRDLYVPSENNQHGTKSESSRFFQAVCLSIYVIVERTCLKYNDYQPIRVDTEETTHLLHSSDSKNHNLDQSDSPEEKQDEL